MPIRFDPESSWKALEKRMAEEGDPVCRGLLALVGEDIFFGSPTTYRAIDS